MAVFVPGTCAGDGLAKHGVTGNFCRDWRFTATRAAGYGIYFAVDSEASSGGDCTYSRRLSLP
jgi:hypothetical protein